MRVLRLPSSTVLNAACLCTWLLWTAADVHAQGVPQEVVVEPAAPNSTTATEPSTAAPVSPEPPAAVDAAPPVAVVIPPPPAGYGASAVVPAPASTSSENPMMAPHKNPAALVEPGTHEHDGFFFRATLGFAGASANGDYEGTSLDVAGGGVLIALAFGKAINENLTLYAELQGMSVSEPEVQVEGDAVDNIRDVGFSSFGLGGSYYFMPLNAFVGGTLGIGTGTVNRDAADSTSGDPSGQTGTGIALGVHAGKEWWVSDNWGIGVAAYGTYLSLPDGRDSTLNALYLGLGASATYN